jgi:hypothetical protein
MEEIMIPPQIFIAATLYDAAEAFLVQHGCAIAFDGARTTVTLPPGATRKLTTKVASDHWRITLPDSIVIRQIYDPGTGCSALYIPAQHNQEGNDE